MIQDNTISYIQRNTYQKINQSDVKKMRFDRILRVTPLQDKPQKNLFYNEDLRGYVQSPYTYIDYEVEIEKARCYFDQKYYKSQDFHRRITYRYDWMKLRIDTSGRHQVLDNFEYLRKNWTELESFLRNDYIGVEVDLYLKQVTDDFGRKQTFESMLHSYFYYGILFPPIPKNHGAKWKKLRKVLISDSSNIVLNETIRFESEDEKIKTYRIEAECINPGIKLLTFSGTIVLSKETGFVEKAFLDLQYDNRITNAWTFSIEKLEHE